MKEQFSQFYDFTYSRGHPPFRALVQTQLQSRISKLVALYQEWEETDFIKHFHQIVLDDSQAERERCLAHWHLVAYIDEARCYLIWQKCRHIPFYKVKSEDFYGFTNETLFNFSKFQQHLSKYDVQHQSKASFKTYILGVLKNLIREKLDDLEDLESDWHLLCDVNISSSRATNNFANKLKEALAQYGITEPRISQYIFAWQFFVPIYKNNHIYQPNNNKNRWEDPNISDFAEAANYYNSQKHNCNAPLQVASTLEATSEIIREWMEICIKSLRQYRKKLEVSLDADNYERIPTIDNELFFSTKELPLEIQSILQEELKKIEDKLPPLHRQVPLNIRKAIMPLCYAQNLAIFSQQELADWLGINQGTIAHYISKHIQKPILNKFQEVLEAKFNQQAYTKLFLETKFNKPDNILDDLLIDSIKKLDKQQQIILRLHYGEKKSLSEIKLILNDNYVKSDKLINIRQQLEIIFYKELTKWQKNYVKYWLKQYYKDRLIKILIQGFKELNPSQKEILKKQYCEKLNQALLKNLYPNQEIPKVLEKANNQLKNCLLRWFDNNFEINLKVADEQIIKIIESWLSRELLYLEI